MMITKRFLAALGTLLTKIDTGRWPGTGTRRLNAAANRFDPHFHQVAEFDQKKTMPPAFIRYTQPRSTRPSR